MNIETFTETRKNKVTSWATTITVRREPATLSEYRARRGRWFDYVGDHVTACFNVIVTFTDSFGRSDTETYYEIVTPAGRGVVISFQDGDELEAFIPNTGKALIYGCWKKYGQYRGHAVGYMRANHLNVNTRSRVEHTCPAKLYAIAAGRKWGV